MQTRLSYSIHGPLLTFWLEGDYTVDAYVEMVGQAFEDPLTPPTVHLLLDGSRSEVDRYPDDIRRLLPAFVSRAHRIRRIAALTRTDVHYGMVRMSAAMLARYGIDVHPFRQRPEAVAWLMGDTMNRPPESAGLSGAGGEVTRSRYRLDGDDIIRWVSEGWLDFAAQNADRAWDAASVVGHSIWSYIEGPEVRHLYELLLRRVRTSRVGIDVPFRCDAPDFRREMRLQIEPLDDGGVQFTVAYPAEGSAQNGGMEGQARAADRGGRSRPDLIPLCSWCDRMLLRGSGWVSVEVAVESLELFDGCSVPRLSHGACPGCYADVMVGADDPD